MLRDGEMSERFKELVLKTSDSERSRGFESHSLRQIFLRIEFNTLTEPRLEKYSSGRRGAPAKGVGRVTVARVQIPPSPPKETNKAKKLVCLFFIQQIIKYYVFWSDFNRKSLHFYV